MEIILRTGDYLAKVKNEIFVLCPEFTGVEQYFRNGENAIWKLQSISFPTDTNFSVVIRYKRCNFTDEKKCLQHVFWNTKSCNSATPIRVIPSPPII